MTDLRNHLFETIERLSDEEKPVEIERAKAIADVAQTIINSAKVELQFMELTGRTASEEFFNSSLPETPAPRLAAVSARK